MPVHTFDGLDLDDGVTYFTDLEHADPYRAAAVAHEVVPTVLRAGGVLVERPATPRTVTLGGRIKAATPAAWETARDTLVRTLLRPRRRLTTAQLADRYVMATAVGEIVTQKTGARVGTWTATFACEDAYESALTPSGDVRTPALAPLPGETVQRGVSYALTPGGSAPVAPRWLITNQAGGVTPLLWEVRNLANGQALALAEAVPAGSALLLDPQAGAYAGSLSSLVGFWPLADPTGSIQIADFSGQNRDLTPASNLLAKANPDPIAAGTLFGDMTRTALGNGWYRLTGTQAGGAMIRLLVTLADLTNGTAYVGSVSYEKLSGGITMDWCDVAGSSATITTPSSGLAATIAASRATYDATFRFLDLALTGSGTISVDVRWPAVRQSGVSDATLLADGPEWFATAVSGFTLDNGLLSASAALAVTGTVSLGGWFHPGGSLGGVPIGKAALNQGYCIAVEGQNGFVPRFGTGATTVAVGGDPSPDPNAWHFVVASCTPTRVRLWTGTQDRPPTLKGEGPGGSVAAAANPFYVGNAHWPFDGTRAAGMAAGARVAMPFVATIELTADQVRRVWARGPQAYADRQIEWRGRFPELDPREGATNTVRLRADHASSNPTPRIAATWRSRYA